MPSWFAKNSLMKMAIRARGHISCHEKPKLNDNKKYINELVNYGLLNRIEDKFVISHPLIHTFVRKNYKPSNITLERIAAYYINYINSIPKVSKNFSLIDQERTHIMQVMTQCKNHMFFQSANSLVFAVHEYLDICGYWTDLVSTLECGVKVSQELKSYKDKCIHLSNLGLVFRDLGYIDKSIAYFDQALSISKDIGDRKLENLNLGNLGNVNRLLGNVSKAIDYIEQAMTISKHFDKKNYSRHLNQMGLALSDSGRNKKAIEYYQQALALDRKNGYRKGEAGRGNTFMQHR